MSPGAGRRIDEERATNDVVHRAQIVLVPGAGRAFAPVFLDIGIRGEGLGAHAAAELEAGHHDSPSGDRPSSWRSRARARNSRVSTAPCCMPIMSAISRVE